MKVATKRVQEEAKAATHGGIKTVDSDCFTARVQFMEESVEKDIAGPPRRTERRAKADLAKLRQAAQGHVTITDGFAAMRTKCRELHHEARVAMGLAQCRFVCDAHKAVDSDPESEADAAAPQSAQQPEGDDWTYNADFTDPAVIQKLFPPPPAKVTKAPPNDAKDTTQRSRGSECERVRRRTVASVA